MNKGMMPDVTGPLGSGARVGWNTEDIGAFDHRKMLIVDGRIAYVGGTGIEDHFNDERFYDVMVRVEGPVVAQLEALFIAGYRHQGGELPTDPAALGRFFPRPPGARARRGPHDGPGERPRAPGTTPSPRRSPRSSSTRSAGSTS